MPLNDPTGPQTTARTPRVRVLANLPSPLAAKPSPQLGSAGFAAQALTEAPGVLHASVTQVNHFHAASFSMEVAASAGPAWWDCNPPLLLDVQFALAGGGWTSLIIGEVDTVSVDPVRGAVSLQGRDLTARLIENKTQEAFRNKTSSEIATIMAQRVGLTAQVTATTSLVGRFYDADHTRLRLGQFSRAMTDWDLLVYLAQWEGFDVFVQGTTLYFQPETKPDSTPFVIQYTTPAPIPRLNATRVQMRRSLTIAKDIEVQVRSWNSRQKHGFTKIAGREGVRKISSSNPSTRKYLFRRPNLTEDQALQFAQQQLTALSRHERNLDVVMPGELSLTPRNMAQLAGTGTSWDQPYYIDEIERSISFSEGFTQRMRCKNSSPANDVVVQ